MNDTPNLPALVAGNSPKPIVPSTLLQVMEFAEVVMKSGLAPFDMNTKEKITVAILHGLEIGLPPLQALQKIAVINGRPAIWGDGAVALVRSKPACEWIEETVTGEGETMVATCRAKRKGEPKPIERMFSVADAKKAGLWDAREKVQRRNSKTGQTYEAKNDSPWFRYPKRMLAMRARGFTLRDLFADVLGGLYLAEELMEATDENMVDVTPAPAGKKGTRALPTVSEKPIETAPTIDGEVIEGDPVPVEAAPAGAVSSVTGKALPPRAQMAAATLPPLQPDPAANQNAEPESENPAPPDSLDIPPILDRRPKAPPEAPQPRRLASTEDPEAFLKSLRTALASFPADQGLAAAEWWEATALPRLDGLRFPSDQEDAMGIWRQHETRFGG